MGSIRVIAIFEVQILRLDFLLYNITNLQKAIFKNECEHTAVIVEQGLISPGNIFCV